MKSKRIASLFAGCFLGVVLASSADASTYTGPAIQVSVGPGTGTSQARVSVYVGSFSSICSGFPNYFSLENADTGVGKLLLAALLTAHASGQSVVITGTGTCDNYGVELIAGVTLL